MEDRARPPEPLTISVLRSEVSDLEETASEAGKAALKWSLLTFIAAMGVLAYAVPTLGLEVGILAALLVVLVTGAPRSAPLWYRYYMARDRAAVRRGELETRVAEPIPRG